MNYPDANSNAPESMPESAPALTLELAKRRAFMKKAFSGLGVIGLMQYSATAMAQTAPFLPAINALVLDEDDAPHCDVDCGIATVGIVMAWKEAGGNTFDLDLELLTPGGTRIAPKAANGVLEGQCALEHLGDEVFAGGVTNVEETIQQASSSSSISSGRYQIFARSTSAHTSTAVTLSVSVCDAQIATGGFVTFPNADESVLIGSFDLSAGGTAVIRVF